MRVAMCRTYGPPDVMKIEEMEKPSLQDEDRVLVRVRCASVNPGDKWMRKGLLFGRFMTGWTKPKRPILGMDFAGTIEAVGKNVSGFQIGDRVFGGGRGCYREYLIANPASICLMPENATFAEGAAVSVVGVTALQALRDVAQIQPGQKVLVYGASGGIGHVAVQLAKAFGAEVTAVCSTANLPWVKALGADHVIDYTRENFAKNGKRYDIILDSVGKLTFFGCLRSLADAGVYISEFFLNPWYHPVQIMLSRWFGRKKAKIHIARFNHADLDTLRGLMAEGRLKPVVEKSYPLEQIAAAHRHMDGGHTKGKIVVEM